LIGATLMRDKLPRARHERSKEGFDITQHDWFASAGSSQLAAIR
jgi:hypothetical protein